MDAISGKSFLNFDDDSGDFKGSADDSDATEEMSDTSSEEFDDTSETGVDLCMKRPEVGDRVYCHFDPEDKEAWYWGRVERRFWKNRLLHYSIQYDDGDRDEEFNAAQGIATEAQYNGRRSNDESSSSESRDSPIADANETPRPTTVASSTTSKSSSDFSSNRKRKYDDVNISTTSERLVDTSIMAQQSKTKTTITSAPTKEMITEWKQRHHCIGTGGQELKGGHRKAQCKGCRCCSVCQPPPWCQKPWEHERTEKKSPPKTPLVVQQKRDTHKASNPPREHNPRNKRSKLRSNSGDEESGLSMPINSQKKPAATKKIVHSSSSVVRAPANKSASAKLPGLLVLEEDRKLLDDFSSKIMEQCRPCWYSKSDRSRKNLKTMTFGHGGLECIHCAGLPNGRRFFFGTANLLSKSFLSIPDHLLEKCPKCSEETKKELRQLQRNLPAPRDKLPGVSRTKYLQRLWYRLQNEGTSEGLAPSIPTVKDPQQRSSDRMIPVAPSVTSKEYRSKRAATANSNNKSRPHRTAPSLPMAAKKHRSTSASSVNPGNNSYHHKTPYYSCSSRSSMYVYATQRRTKKPRSSSSSSSSSRAQPTKAKKESKKKKASYDWEDSDDDSSIGEDLLNGGLSKPSVLVSSAGTVAHLVASPSASEEGGSVGKSKNELLVSGRPPSVSAASDIWSEGGSNSSMSDDSSPSTRGDPKREENEQSNKMVSKGKMIEYLLSMLGFDKLDLGEQEAVSEAVQLLLKPNDIFTSTLLASIEYNNPHFRMHEEVADEFVKQVKKLKEVARKRME